ncbi:MerR family DNA-binding transcriptional regulator [Alicyclobacillus sp.]|uniref:MerR family transcriptional regulator n=1 Tax=Alicyclobacillus sp. TaxID=61169 RepID=UPI0025BF8217|nr:MerR family DNA-binding transcriptional regulator [Alicyclobacillus sp.]
MVEFYPSKKGGEPISRRYTITELTQMFDVTPRTLRHYEEVGLLQPERRGGQRLYNDRDRVRVQLILRGRRLGFSLAEIAEMLELYDTDPTEVAQLRDVLRRGDHRLREIEQQMEELQALREELLEMRDRLQQALNEKLKGSDPS